MKEELQLRKLAKDGLDDIVINIKKATKGFKQKRIPLSLIDRVFQQAKIKKVSTNTAMEQWRQSYNTTLEAIKNILHKASLKYGDEKITLKEVILVMNHVKNNM